MFIVLSIFLRYLMFFINFTLIVRNLSQDTNAGYLKNEKTYDIALESSN